MCWKKPGDRGEAYQSDKPGFCGYTGFSVRILSVRILSAAAFHARQEQLPCTFQAEAFVDREAAESHSHAGLFFCCSAVE